VIAGKEGIAQSSRRFGVFEASTGVSPGHERFEAHNIDEADEFFREFDCHRIRPYALGN
jgi:hypothetical protein